MGAAGIFLDKFGTITVNGIDCLSSVCPLILRGREDEKMSCFCGEERRLEGGVSGSLGGLSKATTESEN